MDWGIPSRTVDKGKSVTSGRIERREMKRRDDFFPAHARTDGEFQKRLAFFIGIFEGVGVFSFFLLRFEKVSLSLGSIFSGGSVSQANQRAMVFVWAFEISQVVMV